MLTRRSFLKSTPLLAFAPTLPAFLARTAQAASSKPDGRVLVVVQLDGGNDALNTIVPFTDPEYAKIRPRLKLAQSTLVKLTDSFGLNNALRPLDKIWNEGQLAVVPGVGYPNASRSHFQSMGIWHTARFEEEAVRTSVGWLGGALDESRGESLVVGNETPQAVRGRRAAVTSLNRVEDLMLADATATKAAIGSATAGDDLLSFVRRQSVGAAASAEKIAALTATKSDDAYPATALGQKLQIVARLLKAGCSARCYYTTQGSYDTHSLQMPSHYALLSELAYAVSAFFADLTAAKLADRVTLLSFSEFGRTIAENGSGGTDHGTAGSVFVAGPGVRGGICGTQPSLTELVKGEPKITTDFRSVYAAILANWLDLPTTGLGGQFPPVELFRRKEGTSKRGR